VTTAPTPDLLPCPFCGAGNTEIRDNWKVWSGMGYTAPTSTSVFHHCRPVAGQPSRAIERVGRDRASAIAAWNQRAELEARKPLPLSDDDRLRLRSDVARAIWDVMREYEGRCDHALEDVEPKHQVWDCADAAIETALGIIPRPNPLIASREVVADGPLRVTRLNLTDECRASLTSKAAGPLPGITGGSS